jgi:GYD domain
MRRVRFADRSGGAQPQLGSGVYLRGGLRLERPFRISRPRSGCGPVPTSPLTPLLRGVGIRNAKESPKRADAFKKMAKTFGVTVKDIVWTQGRYDIVTIVEVTVQARLRSIIAIAHAGLCGVGGDHAVTGTRGSSLDARASI